MCICMYLFCVSVNIYIYIDKKWRVRRYFITVSTKLNFNLLFSGNEYVQTYIYICLNVYICL